MVLTASDHDHVLNYLRHGRNDRCILRRKSKVFAGKDGVLYYTGKASTESFGTWRRVVRDSEERRKILDACDPTVGNCSLESQNRSPHQLELCRLFCKLMCRRTFGNGQNI